MSHERTLIIFSIAMAVLIAVSALIVAWVA